MSVQVRTLGVVVVDAEHIVRVGFCHVLEAQPGITVVGQAGTSDEALRICAVTVPDVVLIEARLPGCDGIETAKAITENTAGCPPSVIVLSAIEDDYLLSRTLAARLNGFALKNIAPDELARAVRVVAGGSAYLSPEITRRLLDNFTIRLPAPPVACDSSATGLTPRELEVLHLLTEGHSNREIALRMFVSEATVKSHVSRLLAKIGARTRLEAAAFARKTGLPPLVPGPHGPVALSTVADDSAPGARGHQPRRPAGAIGPPFEPAAHLDVAQPRSAFA